MAIRTDAPEVAQALVYLRGFIGRAQLATMQRALRGEEGEWFAQRLVTLAAEIKAMPATYDQDGKGLDAVAHLHYFTSGADFWITEKDRETEQLQAFGLADLYGDGGEMGYIGIAEVIACGAELDLHYTPKTLREVRAARKAA